MIEIPKDTLTTWRAINSPGDAGKMCGMHANGIAYPEMFQRALKLGRCKKEVFDTMKKFYQSKAKRLKAVI